MIAAAEADLLDPERRLKPDVDAVNRSARSLDNVVSLLSLAGWPDAAARARRLRDAMLDGADVASLAHGVRRLRRSVERSRILRWSLRGIRPLGNGDLEHHDLPVRLGGDTYSRLFAMLDRVADGDGTSPEFPVDALPHLVTGLDLATARLVIVSLDIGELHPGRAGQEVSHG